MGKVIRHVNLEHNCALVIFLIIILLHYINVEINSADIGFAVFQKKSEYDSAKIEIDDLINKNINKLFLLEKESQLRINDIEYEANAENVRLMLYE